MHRLKSLSTIYRFRCAALLLCAKYLLLLITSAVLMWSMSTSDHRLAVIGTQLMLLTVLIAILQWLVAARTGCPLCMTSVLAKKHCVTHRHARTLLGSYRLQVALTILLRNTFCCPYCNESTAMKVRSNKPHKPTRDRRG